MYAYSIRDYYILYKKEDKNMKWTGLNDLRESYLSFFESKGHLRLNSFPLVPQGDNSVLLINAGISAPPQR